jgi:hypothetical protein
MLINLLWDEPKAGSFAVITTTNITLQDIEKNKRLNIKMDKIPWRKSRLAGLQRASIEAFQNSVGID